MPFQNGQMMSDIDDVKVLAEHVDDHLWWLGELDQYGLPDNYVEYFLATRPSQIDNLLVDVDELRSEMDDMAYDLERAQEEVGDLENAVDELTDDRDTMSDVISHMSNKMLDLSDLHHINDNDFTCHECGRIWPCTTYSIIEDALAF